jgi:hypothetical protein
MLLDIIDSIYIHVTITSFVPPSTSIIIVSCSVYIHVPVSSFVPSFIDGVPKHNYTHKDE